MRHENPIHHKKTDVILVGFQDQDNLGLRYLVSSIAEEGYKAIIITYQSDPENLLSMVRVEKPAIIGFSLIFQYMAPSFASVIAALREHQINTHITIGGHYSSFEYEEVLKRIPGLDSVVRFEGEITTVKLLEKLLAGDDWHKVKGIAYKKRDEIIANDLRSPIGELDMLPLPYRDDIPYEKQETPTASILGSRGCPWNCSFCSIRPFYQAQGGRLRRLRKPKAIVDEMIELYENRNVKVFLFQDDDFLAGGRHARAWGERIAADIIDRGYSDKIAYKISCRSDEIHEDNLKKLMAGGLTHIYMGVESGDAQGLINLNKHITPKTHYEAGKVIKSLGLSFDFGFMLLEPDSTFESVRNNIDFLDSFVGDGRSVASFCRMLPYSGAPIKDRLENEGRLSGTSFEPDYKFLDPKLDLFYTWMLHTFYERNFTTRGLSHVLKILLYEAHLRLPGKSKYSSVARSQIHYYTSVCNKLAFYTLRSAVDYFETTPLESIKRDKAYLQRLTDNEQKEEKRLMHEIINFYTSLKKSKKRQPIESF